MGDHETNGSFEMRIPLLITPEVMEILDDVDTSGMPPEFIKAFEEYFDRIEIILTLPLEAVAPLASSLEALCQSQDRKPQSP